MIHLKLEQDKVVGIRTSWDSSMNPKEWVSRWDWNSYEEVENIAKLASEFSGQKYLPVDCGEHVSPRFDIVKAPVIGEEVSQYFNGDSYPEGVVVKISESYKMITTSTGKKFYRYKQSGSWRRNGFSLISGHHTERNPHF